MTKSEMKCMSMELHVLFLFYRFILGFLLSSKQYPNYLLSS